MGGRKEGRGDRVCASMRTLVCVRREICKCSGVASSSK